MLSHYRSLHYFLEAIIADATKKREKFLAVSAKSWDEFMEGKVDANNEIEMGLNCPRDATGNYFLQTNEKAPFARGKAGTVYESNIKAKKSLALRIRSIFKL